jgi:hypothetical protein
MYTRLKRSPFGPCARGTPKSLTGTHWASGITTTVPCRSCQAPLSLHSSQCTHCLTLARCPRYSTTRSFLGRQRLSISRPTVQPHPKPRPKYRQCASATAQESGPPDSAGEPWPIIVCPATNRAASEDDYLQGRNMHAQCLETQAPSALSQLASCIMHSAHA